jgi:hypothetical protein
MVSPSTTFNTCDVVATGSAATVGGETRPPAAITAMATTEQTRTVAVDLTALEVQETPPVRDARYGMPAGRVTISCEHRSLNPRAVGTALTVAYDPAKPSVTGVVEDHE